MTENDGRPAMCELLIRNAYVLTADEQRSKFALGAVAIAGRRILAVGPDAEIAAACQPKAVIDAEGALVHPGLVDLHYHSSFHMVGKMVGEFDPSADDPGPWVAGQYQRLWDIVGPQMNDIRWGPVDRERSLASLGGQLWRNEDPDALVRGHIAIFGMGSQSDELMRAAKERAEAAGVPFNMHQSQSIDDAEFDDRRYGKHPLVHQYEQGLLGDSVVLTHMNVLREDEFEPVIRSGVSVIWSTNAWYYGSRLKYPSPMPRLFKAGVNVTMGLDVSKVAGFGSELMLTSYLMARDQGDYLSPDDLLQMHTLNGARAMRMDREIGSIEPGKRADLVIRSNDLPEARPMHNLERQHLLVARSRSVDTVIVDGRVVIRVLGISWFLDCLF
jgi:cytosine/adenosine deaminase-related metal-dependent hydrolase